MRGGRLRFSVIIQSPAGARDAVGERSTTWSNIATVFATIEPLKADEVIAASQAQMQITHRVIIRYDSAISAITNGWRVLFGTRVLVIDGILNRDEKDRQLELLCFEGLREE